MQFQGSCISQLYDFPWFSIILWVRTIVRLCWEMATFPRGRKILGSVRTAPTERHFATHFLSHRSGFSVDMIWNATLASGHQVVRQLRWLRKEGASCLQFRSAASTSFCMECLVLPYIFLKILLLVMQLLLRYVQVGEWWTQPKWRCGYPAKWEWQLFQAGVQWPWVLASFCHGWVVRSSDGFTNKWCSPALTPAMLVSWSHGTLIGTHDTQLMYLFVYLFTYWNCVGHS